MPMRLLNAYQDNLPAVEARRQLDLIGAVGLGFGGGRDAQTHLRRLQRLARGESVSETIPRSSLGTLAMLQAANERARKEGTLWVPPPKREKYHRDSRGRFARRAVTV